MKYKKNRDKNYKNLLKCPKCNSRDIIKRGFRKTQFRGKIQRYSCNSCSFRFVEDDGFFRMRNNPRKVSLCLDLFYKALRNSSLHAILDNGFNESGDSRVGLFPVFAYTTKPVINITYNHSAFNKDYSKSAEPSGTYPDTNNRELTDGKRGSGDYLNDDEYSGYQNTNLSIIIDLGEIKSGISTLKASFMEDTGVGIYYPSNVSFYISDDNVTYTFLGSDDKNDSDGWFSFTNTTSFSLRYAKINITAGGSWIFIDEVAVGDVIKIKVHDLDIVNTSLLEIPIVVHFDSDGSYDAHMQSFASNASIKHALDFYINNSLLINIYTHPERGLLSEIQYMTEYIADYNNIKDYSPTELREWVSLRKDVNITNVTYNSTHVTVELKNEFDDLVIEINTTKIVVLKNSTSNLAYFKLNETMKDNYVIIKWEDNKYNFTIITDIINNITVQTLNANQEYNITDYNKTDGTYNYFTRTANSEGFIYFESGGSTHEITIETPTTATTTTTTTTTSSESGGGYAIFKPTQEQLKEGYEKSLRKNWKIQFSFNNETHTIKLNEIVNKTAIITVLSKAIIFNLTINETKKLNLDNDNYYDLQIFLKDISKYEADLVVKFIHEEIPFEEKKPEEKKEAEKKIKEEIRLWLWLVLGLIAVIIAIILIIRYKSKKR
jgi:hypothetical protein